MTGTSPHEGVTMTVHRILALALLTVAVPTIAFAQKTTYDFDKAAPFAQFKTYAMKDGTPVGQPLIDQRIVAAIDAQMAMKGFVKAESDPDVYVLYHMAFDQQKDISSYSSGPMYGGYGWGWGGGWGSTTTNVRVQNILVGTLAIDMVDARKKQVAWRGVATKEVDTSAKPDKRDEKINKAVEKIMKNYPPKART
jgi:hypothetical protein